jgi:hypothetical protein
MAGCCLRWLASFHGGVYSFMFAVASILVVGGVFMMLCPNRIPKGVIAFHGPCAPPNQSHLSVCDCDHGPYDPPNPLDDAGLLRHVSGLFTQNRGVLTVQYQNPLTDDWSIERGVLYPARKFLTQMCLGIRFENVCCVLVGRPILRTTVTENQYYRDQNA